MKAIRIAVVRAALMAVMLTASAPALFAQSSLAMTGVGSASFVVGISLNKTRDLNFGDIVPNAAGTASARPRLSGSTPERST